MSRQTGRPLQVEYPLGGNAALFPFANGSAAHAHAARDFCEGDSVMHPVTDETVGHDATEFPHRKPTVKPWVSKPTNDGCFRFGYNSGMNQAGRQHRVKFYLREWREKKKLRQEELAEKMNTTKATVSKLETGKQQMTTDWIDRAIDALEISAIQLLQHPESQQSFLTDDLMQFLTDEQRESVIRAIEAFRKTSA